MRALEIMTENPRTILETEGVGIAVDILESLDIRHLPVVNEMNELVGMLSDRDLRALLRPYFHPTEGVRSVLTQVQTPVSAVMSSNVAAVEEESDLEEVAELMIENKIGAVPVVDVDNQVVGIISYLDILRQTLEPSA